MRWPWQRRCTEECQFAYQDGWGIRPDPYLRWVRCRLAADHYGQMHASGAARWFDHTPRTLEERTA